jgi:hypothetical protein
MHISDFGIISMFHITTLEMQLTMPGYVPHSHIKRRRSFFTFLLVGTFYVCLEQEISKFLTDLRNTCIK